MKTIIFATQNQNKLNEVKAMLQDFKILGLKEMDYFDDIPETGTTFYENARLKVEFIYEKFGLDCFSDDSGLSIDALDGDPGVYSSRYAGEPADTNKNIEKVLAEMKGKTNRQAHFITVIAMQWEGRLFYFEGKVFGTITEDKRGTNGFGYDPIFIPNGFNRTFAEMTREEKAEISHRGKAVQQLIEFLHQN